VDWLLLRCLAAVFAEDAALWADFQALVEPLERGLRKPVSR
jgi:hypothetical protein